MPPAIYPILLQISCCPCAQFKIQMPIPPSAAPKSPRLRQVGGGSRSFSTPNLNTHSQQPKHFTRKDQKRSKGRRSGVAPPIMCVGL